MSINSIKISHQSFHSINILRGVAALGVFWYHQQYGRVLAKYTNQSLFNLTDQFGSTYAVPLFFLISGFCIHLSSLGYLAENRELNLKAYFTKRLKRIYPPYLIALLFAIIINWLIKPSFYLGIKDFIVHLFVLQGFFEKSFNTINLVFWTISIELAFYFLYPLFFFLRKKYALRYVIAIISIISTFSIVYFINVEYTHLVQRYFVLNLWLGWCMGAFISDKIFLDINFNWKKFLLLLYPLLGLLYLLVYLNKISVLVLDELNILIWIGPLLFVFNNENWLHKNYNLLINLFVKIGLLSYSLYLLHQPLIMLKNFIIQRYIPVELGPYCQMLGFPIIIWLSWLHYNRVEKPFLSKKV
ncbi:acyltransferase family protein [Pedobacter sp. PF22-3]|uniref:acyltransferase family protein n=1 Tax=Pedobacter sp. PF22-3 TaxID=2994467 RepID=UPI002246CE28|nr:acyltransferase family protein [Pedobacter sp. PF22-3]MCX2492583.1 acyltransferase family protein [Pedobacter sp. PF22-3]